MSRQPRHGDPASRIGRYESGDHHSASSMGDSNEEDRSINNDSNGESSVNPTASPYAGTTGSLAIRDFTFAIRPFQGASAAESRPVLLDDEQISRLKKRSQVLREKIRGFQELQRFEDRALEVPPHTNINCDTYSWFIDKLSQESFHSDEIPQLRGMVVAANLIWKLKCDARPFQQYWMHFKALFNGSDLSLTSADDVGNKSPYHPAYLQPYPNVGAGRPAYAVGSSSSSVISHRTPLSPIPTPNRAAHTITGHEYFQYLILSVVFIDEQMFRTCFKRSLLEFDDDNNNDNDNCSSCIPELAEGRHNLLNNVASHCQGVWSNLRGAENGSLKRKLQKSKKLEEFKQLLQSSHSSSRTANSASQFRQSVRQTILDNNDLQNGRNPTGHGPHPHTNLTVNEVSGGRDTIVEDIDPVRLKRLFQKCSGRGPSAAEVAGAFITEIDQYLESQEDEMWKTLSTQSSLLQSSFQDSSTDTT